MILLNTSCTYADAQEHCSKAALWALFDGSQTRFNIAHECLDRHATDPQSIAVRIANVDGKRSCLTFAALAARSAQFAHWLADRGIKAADRVT